MYLLISNNRVTSQQTCFHSILSLAANFSMILNGDSVIQRKMPLQEVCKMNM